MEPKEKIVETNFIAFISGLFAEGLVAMGAMQHPVTKEAKEDLEHLTMVIETLAMLKEKTNSNLTNDESDALEQIISQLRMGYVSKVNNRDGVNTIDKKPGSEE